MNTNLTITTVENEARILDTELAEALGYEEPRAIRKLISRHEGALSALGTLARRRVPQLRSNGATHLIDTYYLNKAQAIFLTTQSGTSTAINITVQVIQKFDAYEKGMMQPALPNFANPAEAARAWAEQYENRVKAEALLVDANDKVTNVIQVIGTHRHTIARFVRTIPGVNSMAVITKSGLFKLILRSDKPEARKFQDWVTREVLPAIEKDGMYVTDEEKVRTSAGGIGCSPLGTLHTLKRCSSTK